MDTKLLNKYLAGDALPEEKREVVRWMKESEEHREQLNLIAEKLLELETLDEKTIRSLFETGQMPSDSNTEEYPSEKAQSFEEAKRALEKKEAEKLSAAQARGRVDKFNKKYGIQE